MQSDTLIAVDLAKTVFEIGVSLRPDKISERRRVQREQFLGRPPPVDRGLADPGPLGHGVHAHPGQAVRQQQVRGRLQDRGAGLFAARPAGPGRLGCQLRPPRPVGSRCA